MRPVSAPAEPGAAPGETLRPLVHWPAAERANLAYVLTDIDDTLTTHGRLPAVAYVALERLAAAGLQVIAVTGRPAGWCDHIARMWPVAGVVGENGAFWFRHDPELGRLVRRFHDDEPTRRLKRARLFDLEKAILAQVPGTALASDQLYREADLAIDFCEDVPALPPDQVDRIVALFEAAGAVAKVSSIHVNGWFGDYDKLSMARVFFTEALREDLDRSLDRAVYLGDSPNDQPMFAAFPTSIGVANVRRFAARMTALPRWVTAAEGGEGFAEAADAILSARAA